jgi:hypothetical protein
LSQKSFIPSPNGGLIYGYVEGKNTRGIVIEDGPVVLQKGFRRTFGQEHIWARHSNYLAGKGYETIDDVANFVADILQHNTPVAHEGLAAWEESKLFAIRGAVGFAVLKQIVLRDGQTAYSVTTAYQRPRAGMSPMTRIVHREGEAPQGDRE